MIPIGDLRTRDADEFLVFDTRGAYVTWMPDLVGHAVLGVREVTDAVKEVDGGLVKRSVDREEFWSVEYFALDPAVLQSIPADEMSPEELIRAVQSAGYDWRVVTISSSV